MDRSPKYHEYDVVEIYNPLPYGKTLPKPSANASDQEIYEYKRNPKQRAISWDGRPYPIEAGETQARPWFIAQHMAKHIVDDLIINNEAEENGMLKLGDPEVREFYERQVLRGVYEKYDAARGIPTAQDHIIARADALNKEKNKAVDKGESNEESGLESLTRDELREIAKEKGISYKATDGKPALLKLINEHGE